MAAVIYPNREHENADKAARRRALAALRNIINEADMLIRLIENGGEPDGNDAKRFADEAVAVAVNLSAMETLRDVREWHAADINDAAAEALS